MIFIHATGDPNPLNLDQRDRRFFVVHNKPRKVRPGATALDCHGNILHFDPTTQDWGPRMIEMARDVELLMLGMVEIKVINRLGREWYYPTPCNPVFLYADFLSSRRA